MKMRTYGNTGRKPLDIPHIRFHLRIPAILKDYLIEVATNEGKTTSQIVVDAIAHYQQVNTPNRQLNLMDAINAAESKQKK